MSDISSLVTSLIRPEIKELVAYQVQPADGMIKLDAMENPYVWDEGLQAKWLERAKQVDFNRYPDPAATKLRAKLKQHLNLPAEQEILFGNGSDELIQLIMLATARSGCKVFSIAPTFVMYAMTAKFVGVDYVEASLKPDFSLDLPATLTAIEAEQPAVIFIAYPNNPTGNAFAREEIEAIIQAAPGLVVVDEAYNAFAEDSFLPDVEKYNNLLVMRTFSKVGLAGFRLGFLVANSAWIAEFDKVRMPYNINVFTQEGVLFALENYQVLEKQAEQIKQDRELLIKELTQFSQIETIFKTAANFITIKLQPDLVARVFAGLKQDKILIKNLDSAGGLLKDCLRITVGSPAENQAFLASFAKYIK